MPRALLLLVLLFVPVAYGQSAPEPVQQQEVLRGERLDPALYGPGVLESMDEVMAREQARPADSFFNPKARGNQHGAWVVPRERATYRPHSGEHYVTNKWGDTRMGIGFPDGPVTVVGAWVAGQGAGRGVWPAGLRVVGYRDGQEVGSTAWFDGIRAEPSWLAIDLREVDRIIFEARPTTGAAAWYALDDFTFLPSFIGATSAAEPVVLSFEDCRPGQKLTGSDYAGLVWEEGTSDFRPDYLGIHTPHRTPGDEEDDGETDSQIDEEPRGPRDVTLPLLGTNYQGVIKGDAGQDSFPPDTCGAVGPNHFLEVVNTNFSVYAKSSGTRVVNTSLSSFHPGSVGDPRVLYDQHSGRWVTINTNFNWSGPSRIFLAVSTTNDPTGTWFKTDFIAQEGSDASCWVDYPTLGVDANGIYVSANMVDCDSSTVFAIDKAPLIAASPSLGTVTAFRGLSDGTIQPVHTFDSPAYQYFISRSSSTGLRVHQLSGPLTAPTLVTVGTVTVPSHAAPPSVPALGSTTPLDSVDRRLMNAVYRGGYIWTTNTINSNNRAACRWYKINPVSLTLIEYGTVSDSSLHYFFPSIMVNSAGSAFMGFSGANADQYVACYYTGRLSSDTPGQMATPALLKAGMAPQNNIDGYGRNRWGDYSLCSLDPADDTVVWTIQAYGHGTNIWGTWIGRLTYTPDVTPPTPDPLTFYTAPYADSTSSIRMVAALADDASPPVQYLFDFVAGGSGGSDGDWQEARMYLDSGLQINTNYTYRVKARDSATTPNETAWSTESTAATLAAVPSAPTLSSPTANSMQADVQPGVNPAYTQLALQCTATNPPDSNWTGMFVTAAGTASATPTWQTDAAWGVKTITGLQPSTSYTFAAKARNLDNIETGLGLATALTTLSTAAGACCFTDGGCSTMTAVNCGIAGGVYQGDYVACEPNPCPLACEVPGDMNEDWLVDGLDIPGFVEAVLYGYHPCADLTAPEGELDADDIAAFVSLLLYSG